MSKTTTDLLPGNLLNRVKDHDVRIERLESLARRDLSGAAALLLQEITTGAWFRLECEIIAGEPSLFLVPAEGN